MTWHGHLHLHNRYHHHTCLLTLELISYLFGARHFHFYFWVIFFLLRYFVVVDYHELLNLYHFHFVSCCQSSPVCAVYPIDLPPLPAPLKIPVIHT